MIITIDGLGVNGKSTLSKMLSKEINFKNLNTGAIYRCIALEIINNNYEVDKIEYIIDKLAKIKIDFNDERVILNGVDVSNRIRQEDISLLSTKWATIKEIKSIVKAIQLQYLKSHNTIIEGRDIGTRIVPNADLKFYLYSDFETRVKRQYNENKNIPITEIIQNLYKRDCIDIEGGNFIKPENSIEIDTTNKTIEEVYKIMREYIFQILKI